MKKHSHNKEVSAGKRFSHFLKHYFGYVLLAFLCAVATVLVVAVGEADTNDETTQEVAVSCSVDAIEIE